MSPLTRKLVRDLRRQWLQFAAISLTLALGVAVFGAAFDSYANLETSYRDVYEQLRFADVTVTGGDASLIADAASKLDGVASVTTRLQTDVPFRITHGSEIHTLLGRLVGQPGRDNPPVDRILVQRGNGIDPAQPDHLVAERHMADHFHLAVGSTLEVFVSGVWQRVEVGGIGVSPEYLWPARDREDLLTSPDDFGVLFASDAFVRSAVGDAATSQALVRYGPSAQRGRLDQAVREIAVAHGASDVLLRADHPSAASLQEDVDGFRELAVLFPFLFFVAAALTAYVLLGRLVRRQRSLIGMLAANGFPQRRIVRHYLAYGAAVGLVGSLTGAGGGMLLAIWLTRTYASSLGIPLAVAHLHPLTPLVGILLGTGAALAAAAAPARAAARVLPAEAMRSMPPPASMRASVIDRLPGVRGLPLRIRVGLRNVRRNRKRSVSTGLAVALAGVLVLSSLGLLDTVSLVFDDQFHHIERQDAQIFFATAPDAAEQASIATAPGVAATEPALDVPIVVTNGERRYQTALTGFRNDTTMHRFPSGLPVDGLVAGSGLRTLLGVTPGSVVQVSVADQPPVTVTVSGFVDEPLGARVYAALPTVERLANGHGLHSMMVRYQPGISSSVMRQQLVTRPGVVAVRDRSATEQAVGQLLGLFYAIVGVMLLFGSILALVILVNTLSVNVSERAVEMGTLRALGARIVTLARMLTVENLFVVVAAIPFGVLAGWLTARWLMGSFNSDLYHFSLRLRVTTPVLVAIALVVCVLVAHLPARRAIARLDVARIVREQAV